MCIRDSFGVARCIHIIRIWIFVIIYGVDIFYDFIVTQLYTFLQFFSTCLLKKTLLWANNIMFNFYKELGFTNTVWKVFFHCFFSRLIVLITNFRGLNIIWFIYQIYVIFMSRSMTVSYTHLDVYKRQYLHLPAILEVFRVNKDLPL